MRAERDVFDRTGAVVAAMAMREQLIEEIEKAIYFRQSGNAARALQVLRGFDSLAERLCLLDDRDWERRELSDKIMDILSLPSKEEKKHVGTVQGSY